MADPQATYFRTRPHTPNSVGGNATINGRGAQCYGPCYNIFAQIQDSHCVKGFRLSHAERRFGELISPPTLFGHHGATGCVMWGRATSGVSCAMLSNLPELCYSLEFNKLSDLVCSALEI